MRRNLTVLLAAIAVVVASIVAGATLASLKLPPGPQIAQAIEAVKDLQESGLAYLGLRPVQHLEPLVFDHTGFSAPDPKRVMPGVTFLASIFDGRFTARLYSARGELIHEWPVDFFDLAADEAAFRFDALVHGTALYPNGDIVANLDGRGIYRISACGDVIWKNHDRSHHSIDIDDSGVIWTPIHTHPYSRKSIYRWNFRFDKVAAFDATTGAVVEEIDLVDIIVGMGGEGIVTANELIPEDMAHVNDVEILDADMAPAFPLFEAGDILVNSRHFNQMWILDGRTHALKWWMTGPMKGAHDPDFQPDGTITLLDNRPGGDVEKENGGRLGGSRILRIDPVTRNFETLYQSGPNSEFYTPYRGKHQLLENSNILIAETDRGRAMEVAPDGSVVWEYINAYDKTTVAWMMDAIHYPESYGDFAAKVCPGS